ncbi:MAG TPA: AraC family transcriptional regulator [Bryobacteraceae bacterium]
MTKIAVEMQRACAQRFAEGSPGGLAARTLARGDGWTVQDIICTSGTKDRSFAEQHQLFSVAMVLAGSFQYRGSNPANGHGELMTPGSMLLGNPGQNFECGHEHATGDRCLSFHYSPEYFERIAADAGVRGTKTVFPVLKFPPLRGLAPLLFRASTVLHKSFALPPEGRLLWEELSLEVAVQSLRTATGHLKPDSTIQPSTISRVTGVLRTIEENLGSMRTLTDLAQQSGLSPYHFLRTFEQVTGLTPHQYVRRLRLAEAAVRLSSANEKALDIAIDCGFNGASNFSRAFRSEVGTTPRDFRKQSFLRVV